MADAQTSTSAPAWKPPLQMPRPGLGHAGKPIQLLCNHFMVNYSRSQDVCYYNVSISDEGSAPAAGAGIDGVASRNLRRTIICKLLQAREFGGMRFSFDGEKSLFTPGAFQFHTQEFTVWLQDSAINKLNLADDLSSKRRKMLSRKTREFRVKIEYAATVQMGAIDAMLRGHKSDRARDALRVLDIVLKQHASSKGYLLIKDNYFSPMFGVADIGMGVQTWRGYHVSFRPSLQGLSLNLDIATTTVIKPSRVLDFMREHFDLPTLNHIDWHKVKRVLKGVKVETTHTQAVHRIMGFTDASCTQQTFVRRRADESGQVIETELTIQQYYKMQYNISLRFPNMPCIVAGRTKKPAFIPVELCSIVAGQRFTKALSRSQREKMISQARQSADERRHAVQKAMDVGDYSSNQLVKDFNIEIDSKMREIPARLLEAPALMFGGHTERPKNGRWSFDKEFLQPAPSINSSAVINFDGRMPPAAVENIAKRLWRLCNSKGMSISIPESIICEEGIDWRLPAAERVNLMIQKLKSRQPHSAPSFLLCILPKQKTSDLYGPLKKMLQTKWSIVTQCIAPPSEVTDRYLTNVALKINAKMGGYNSLLEWEVQLKLPKISDVPTVIFGMDVSHGPAGYSDSPSIAAVVASREWPYFSKYSVRLRAQPRKVEMIAGLYEDTSSGGMIVELLTDFYNSCQQGPGRWPARVIVFRDGVSESQFEQVLREEYLSFKRAFKKVDASGRYEPRITLIVVQKRHHTRFFPSTGRGNVMPGTIVDAALGHPRDYDFYLCAHAGSKHGTVRPTHYHVLVDENNFTVDELQQITHALCYTYARSTTAISTVAPVTYAHLAAAHARNFLDSEGGSETSSVVRTSEGSTSIHLPELHPAMKSKMFYC